MPFLALHVVLVFLLDLANVPTRADHDQALELLLLRQQLRLYERPATRPRPAGWEKVTRTNACGVAVRLAHGRQARIQRGAMAASGRSKSPAWSEGRKSCAKSSGAKALRSRETYDVWRTAR